MALLVPVAGYADEIDDALSKAGFIEKTRLDEESVFACLSTVRDHFVVERDGGSIRIVLKSPGAAEPKPEFSAGPIRYVWDNQGEFGGELEAIWPDKRSKILIRENVWSMIQSGEFLYVFTGLSHMADTGAVYRISNFDSNPEVSLVTLLPGKPLPLLDSRRISPGPVNRLDRFLYDTGFFIITSETLVVLRPDIRWLNVVAHHPVWESMKPNSAVQVGDRILVGMCPGVAVAEFHNSYNLKDIRLFVPGKTVPAGSGMSGR